MVLFRLEFGSGAGADLMLFKPEFGSVFQVGVSRTNNSVSPLSLRERARVRGFWRYTQATLLTSNFEPENRWSFIDYASKVAAGL
ncbi:hypothetical protein BK673_10910 [Pseudomonas fluorescens]|uniref:Uncharacterized protein n=1 Tax=Pseudomonas fluorescens TaxID=294 RepID=A0A423P717_PSEFL|nr:hypothetical protein BK673_10910 [Pseudomonas fluorescens]